MQLFDRWAWILCALGVTAGYATVGEAQTGTAGAVSAAPAASSPPAPAPTGLWDRDTLTGDWGGLRPYLQDHGVTWTFNEIAETLGNVSGGVHTGFIVEGRFLAGVNVDLEKAVGWSGGLFYADAYQIHGRGLSTNNVHNLLTVSNIEAARSTRLHDLYLQQSVAGDAVSVRVGQIAADDEFIISQYGANFVNAMFGWPGLPSVDLPAGGPAYPLSTPGVRVRYAPDSAWTFMSGIFNGNPAGPPTSGNQNPNPQLRDASGTDFNVNSDIFVIAEAGYSIAPDKDTPGLPATYKFGAWYHSGKFADEHFDSSGLSLASPASDGIPRNDVNDFSLYGVVDQMIWRRPGTANNGFAAFVRAMGAPGDRNEIDFYADGGLNLLGIFSDSDVAGVAFAYGRISSALADLDHDVETFSGTPEPIQDYEAVVELTYSTPIAPWWVLQPDLQYVIHPGGYVANPDAGDTAIKNAVVLGLRTTITF